MSASSRLLAGLLGYVFLLPCTPGFPLFGQSHARPRPPRVTAKYAAPADETSFRRFPRLQARGQTGAQPGRSAVTGDWVARQIEDRDTGRDGRFELRMRLFDRHGRVRERALTMSTLRGPRHRPADAKTPASSIGDRLLIRFTYPNDIKGTAFLVWEHPGGPGSPGSEDERFLYLPALGRVRRIAGAESQESFVGSDFTYEDIGGRELDDYTYALLDENASWTAPGGDAHPAYRLESRAKDPQAVYPRVISLVRKDNVIVVHAEIFNRRGEVEKVYDARRVDRIEGIWTTMEMVMANHRDKTRTEMSMLKADYNVGLRESDFTRRELERGPS